MTTNLSKLILIFLCAVSLSCLAKDPHFTWHDKGLWTPMQASQMDPRFHYMLYVPKSYDENASQEYPLLVLIHGTERGAFRYIENNAKFADENNVVLLAPMFPANTHGGKDIENYKLIDYKGTRYDLVLLSMVDEIASKYRLKSNKFSMFGFSGGGHFTHRFFYLHPHRLNAISIGAPGMVTLIDNSADWWVGTKDLYSKFNAHLNINAMRKVNVHMVIGEQDVKSWQAKIDHNSPYHMPDEPRATYHSGGKNRQDKMRSLKKNFEDNGITVEIELVPDTGHSDAKIFPAMRAFFKRQFSKQ